MAGYSSRIVCVSIVGVEKCLVRRTELTGSLSNVYKVLLTRRTGSITSNARDGYVASQGLDTPTC